MGLGKSAGAGNHGAGLKEARGGMIKEFLKTSIPICAFQVKSWDLSQTLGIRCGRPKGVTWGLTLTCKGIKATKWHDTSKQPDPAPFLYLEGINVGG
jgi:hypothetical protein